MAIRYYPAIFERTSDGFAVSFPDVPGCISHGDSLEHATAQAEEALAGHFRVMRDFKQPLPEPSALDALPPPTPEEPEAARLLVRADLPGRAVKLNITLESSLLEAVDAASSREGKSRSAFLADAAKAVLRERVSA